MLPLLVGVGAIVTTEGVEGRPCPRIGVWSGPDNPLLGVLTGELRLVAGEETGDSLLGEEPRGERERWGEFHNKKAIRKPLL